MPWWRRPPPQSRRPQQTEPQPCLYGGVRMWAPRPFARYSPGGDSGVTPSSFSALLLLAQGDVSPLAGILPLAMPVVVIFFMYIMLIQRPQKREQEQRQVMLSALKKNDHVLLSSGIFGVVTNVREDSDEITIRVDESSNTKLRVTRAAIARVISDQPTEAPSASV